MSEIRSVASKRPTAYRLAPRGTRDFGAGEPYVLELEVAHRAKLGNRRPFDALFVVGLLPPLQGRNNR